MLRLGRQLRFSFSSDSTFVTLTLNGSYEGVYELCEQVEEGEGRVPLSPEEAGRAGDLPPQEASLSFLIEMDERARAEGDVGLDYFCCNDFEIPFTVKDDTTREKTAAVKAFTEACDEAILSGDLDEIERVIDVDSFVDMYLLEEFAKDRDVGFSSMFYAKREGGKLACTAPWDFDLALGNDSGLSTGEDHASPEGVMATRNRWFAALARCAWFRHLLAERLEELTPLLEQISLDTEEAGARLAAEAVRNDARWEVFSHRALNEPPELAALPDYPAHVAYLVRWMRDRLAWMRSYYIEEA